MKFFLKYGVLFIVFAFVSEVQCGLGQKLAAAKATPMIISKLKEVEPIITQIVEADNGWSVDQEKPIKDFSDVLARYNSEADATKKVKNLLSLGEFALLKLQTMQVVIARVIQAVEQLKALAPEKDQTQLDGLIGSLKRATELTDINSIVRDMHALKTQKQFQVTAE